jgi:hypothetical protein
MNGYFFGIEPIFVGLLVSAIVFAFAFEKKSAVKTNLRNGFMLPSA